MLDDWYLPSIYPKGEDQCSNTFQCFLFVLALGPRSSGGIADMIQRQSYEEENRTKYIIWWLYGIIAFAILNIIGLNILFGIILDTFKELRIRRQSIEEDQLSNCFICGIKAEWVPLANKVRSSGKWILKPYQI